MIKLIRWWIEDWKEAYENPDSIRWMTYMLQSYRG